MNAAYLRPKGMYVRHGTKHVRAPRNPRTSENSVKKLSEKGFERRSERGIGRYIGAKIGRTVRCRGSVQLSFGCLQDFSDSFVTEFYEFAPDILNLHNWPRSSTQGGALISPPSM